MKIEDEELRRKNTLKHTKRWFTQDADAAGNWLISADVPNAWRHAILKNMPVAKSWARAANIETGD